MYWYGAYTSHNLNSLNRGYTADHILEHCRLIEGEVRSLDYSSYRNVYLDSYIFFGGVQVGIITNFAVLVPSLNPELNAKLDPQTRNLNPNLKSALHSAVLDPLCEYGIRQRRGPQHDIGSVFPLYSNSYLVTTRLNRNHNSPFIQPP